MKQLFGAALALCAMASFAAEDGLDCLVPAPRILARKGRTVPSADIPAAVRDQSYEIVVCDGEAKVTAGGANGRRYAETTLKQLRKLNGGAKLADCTIRDWPELKWRGFMLDCGRNWQSVETVKALLDFMADYKLNLFHWHLTDYWGWRLASKAVPELSTDAATIRNVGKRYSQAEFLEIVDYAAARGITVLPEFDVPGHTHAFRRALGIETMRDPKADRAVKAFLDEFVALVPPEKVPYVHLGTDEVRNAPEKVDAAVVREWARHAAAKGHTVVGWAPGIDLAGEGVAYVPMQWGQKDESKGRAFFDMTARYIDIVDPFELLSMASYAKPCPWDVPAERKLGALIGGWHDDTPGEDPTRVFRNNPVFPAIVLNADAFWRGRDADRPDLRARLPMPTDPAFALAQDLERRVVAQRDRVIGEDFAFPFAFLAQTSMRWRLTYDNGDFIATDVPQATIHPHYFRAAGCSYVPVTNRTVVAETWISSPCDQTVGAWIGFTALSRSSGRAVDGPTPKLGEWNRYGATVELNGERLAPPAWRNPGLEPSEEEKKVEHFWSFAKCSNVVPWTNEEFFMREPARIALKKGWNHVKLTMPPSENRPVAHWVGTFVPMLGTSERPREVPGLGYSAYAPAEFPMEGISFDVPQTWPCPELTRDGVKALWLDGEPLAGKPTRVFAYLALPEGASAAKKAPGIVLAHGGGGTAYITWAQTWAKKGYAVIVVDNCGAIPVRAPGSSEWARCDNGGPAGWGRFEKGLEPPCEQWPYHAVGALVRAHSYLRSLPEVDADRTGLTGISWGGYLTMLTAATDRRFKFAMPVYACGYYEEMARDYSFYDRMNGADPKAAARWCELFDSKNYAAKLDLPVMWFASTNDKAFPFELLQRTIRLPKAMPQLAIRVRMKHSHGPHGENMPELFRFADHVLSGAPDLPAVGMPEVRGGEIAVAFDARGNALKRIDLNWCCDDKPGPDTKWETQSFDVPADGRFVAKVPEGATCAYVNVVLAGETGEAVYPEALVSSPAVTVK